MSQVEAPDDDELPELPATLAVFPLSGAVLLPRGVLPLNIFEPRYLAMVRDAMAGSKAIGIVQPRDPEADPSPLYDVGCAGHISDFRETGDGRIIIALTGVSRFGIVRELDVTTRYRQVVPDYARFEHDRDEPRAVAAASRAQLETTLKDYLDDQGLSADWDAVAGADDESLITTLSAVCPFDPVEKQALLEAPDLPARAATLTALMTFAQGSSGDVLQ
jgi:Lon protease-like protein